MKLFYVESFCLSQCNMCKLVYPHYTYKTLSISELVPSIKIDQEIFYFEMAKMNFLIYNDIKVFHNIEPAITA